MVMIPMMREEDVVDDDDAWDDRGAVQLLNGLLVLRASP